MNEKRLLYLFREKTISCSLDPATNSETKKLIIQDFFGSTSIQAWRKKKNLRQKIQFPSKLKKICPLYDQLCSDGTVQCISMQDRALQCDVILIEIMIIKQMLIHHYLSDPHLLFKWSKSLIVGPHLSGFESLGQTVTVGKGNSSMG